MSYRIVTNILGRILLIESGLLLAPMAVAALYGESLLPWLWTIVLTLALGGILVLFGRSKDDIRIREGFVSVALGWIVIALFGALPFVFSGAIPHYVDALFEIISGLTTTGASILSAVEGLPQSILFWRSFSHFIGGMGVLVFMMAILPMDDEHSIHLLRAETPGPVKGKLVPRMRSSSRILYLIYIGLTMFELVFLLCVGMPLFDSLCTAFGTAGTGGFGIKNASIGAYDSAYLQTVVAVFMMLFGINFNLYYLFLLKRSLKVFKNTELFWYLGIILFATVTIGLSVAHLYGGFFPALRYSFFQVSSIMTSTGYGTADFNLWPQYSRTILVLLMVVGACAGSTGGGTKVARLVIAVKAVYIEIRRLLFPRAVNTATMDGVRLEDRTIRNTLGYYVLYALIAMVSCLLLSLEGHDMETTVTSVIACLSNIGPGLNLVGPMGNFGFWSIPSKLLLCLCMLLGRLEIFPMLILFAPGVWAPRKK